MIKKYLCVIMILSAMMGYGQIEGNKVKVNISPVTNNTVTVTVAVTNTVTNTVSFLSSMPIELYTPPLITAPTINIQEILSNPSSSEEDKAKAHEALAIQQAQEAQAAAALAQIQSLVTWIEAQLEVQVQAQTQAQAQAQAEAFLGSLQQLSQSIANGGTVNTNTDTTVTWYFDNDGDGYHSNTATTKIMSAPGWKTSTNGLDCDDNNPRWGRECDPVRGWFLDNDGDGYFATVQMSSTKPITPAGNWTDATTKGPDCNDNVFSTDNSVCSTQIQGGPGPGKDYVPKSTDKLVKAGIVTTCEKQSTLGVCVLTSLEVTLKNVLGVTVTSKEINTAAYINTGDAYLILNGLNPVQTIQFINSFCNTEALTKNDFKTAIDAGKTFITDIKTGTIITPDPAFPNDRTKDTTVILSHSVSVIGYDVDGNYIYIDPALGKAQVAPPTDMGFSYSIIIKGKK